MPNDPRADSNFPDFESQPLTRGEYIQSVIHLYRGEMQRAVTWRSRLDATTNWAIVVTITALSYAFGAVEHPHVIIILANVVILTLLWVEARRYRYYDVWRTRLRGATATTTSGGRACGRSRRTSSLRCCGATSRAPTRAGGASSPRTSCTPASRSPSSTP